MKNKFSLFYKLIISSLVLTSFNACSNLPFLTGNTGNTTTQQASFKQPDISIKSFSLGDTTLQEINFKVILTVDNQNDIGIKTSNIDYNLDISKSEILKGSLANGIDIPAKKQTDVEIPLKVSTQKLITALPNIVTNLSSLDYAVYGVVNFDTPIGKVPINWRKEDKINLISLAGMILSLLSGGGK